MDMFPSLTPGVSARSTGGESGNPRENQDGAKWRLFDRFFEGLVPVTRFWGVATAIGYQQ
ncbi:unnamed protein product [Phyllotreta striolata]|uniref:Uncharacterized protein n=1 Tax=Phyllotreta striolata TaxID=444603 RepID=A0A9N9XLM2_PHYSR|nr:unnamed protein product [Phyllotreta striolata]